MPSAYSTNLSTGTSTKPTRMIPDYLANTQNYIPLSLFFAGVPEQEADPDSLFGFRMPSRKQEPKGKKKAKSGATGGKGEKEKPEDDSGEKGSGSQADAEGPQRAQTSKPRPAASAPAQALPQAQQAGGKQESLSGVLGRLLGAVQGQSIALQKQIPSTETTLTANVPTILGNQSWQSIASPVDESAANAKSIALMKWLSKVAQELGVGRHVYVVGGAVRNFVIDKPIKDVDVVIDAVSLGRGRDSEWFAKQLQPKMGAKSSLVTNQYGVAILTVKGDWDVSGHNLKGEVIEIANARSESYGGVTGKGYKPSEVKPASIEKDIRRREFTFNALMWRLADLAKGPDKAEIVDLTGCGLADLKANTMRCPVDPDKTFSDDPTRMLRAIKFMIKYGFKISGDTEKSIRRNAAKIRNAPSSAIAKLLIDPILKEPKTAFKALREMKRLGLLDVVADMIRTDKQFASTLAGWANDQRVSMLFELMDLGLPLKTKLLAFTPSQQAQIRKATATMPDDRALEFLAALKQPGKAWKDKLFVPVLATELGIEKSGMGSFAAKLNALAQEILLSDPVLLDSPDRFKSVIRQKLSVGESMTTTANVPTLSVPIGAGDGKKFLDFKDDAERRRKRKRRSMSRRLYVLLRQ